MPHAVRLVLILAALGSTSAAAQARGQRPRPAGQPTPDTASGLSAATLSGLRFRSIGPAVTGGRIGEIVVDPKDRSTWYVGVHSGGVWKTVNAGTTWTPVFDSLASYSIGTVAIDPTSSLTVWAGTGENNSQRSVGWGDGVYKSTDAGRTWRNVGLKASYHIGRIAIDPRNGDVVYVAAIGSLWSSGGDRGVYKTTDGGRTWDRVLTPDNEWTGAYWVEMDPRNPDVLYATTWQRARRQWGFVDGGPGSAIYKSLDAGKTWTRMTRGLPRAELGKIGLAVSPVDPDVVYAIVEATGREGGFFRSADGGQNWQKMSSTVAGPPFYYHKLYPDPKTLDRVYSVDVRMSVTEDGGRTFHSIQGRSTHVDNHAFWIDPGDTRHLLNGNDGGLYESFDRGATWSFKANLPITQFYKLSLDNAEPFYNLCGGTQDNNTVCGPSETMSSHGATNADWFILTGGDGFQPRIDPEDPNIMYGESQHGELVRYDRKTGERIEIQPQPEPGEPPLRWNWDSPLLISPFSHTRLYFGAQRLFRSDDRGDTWRAISPDLTRQIDRNRLKIMGRVQSMDAIAKNTSTSLYGAIVVVAESRKQEGLLYVGTDDGLIQATEDDGATWRTIASFPGVPDTAFVSDLEPSRHDADVVYAAFNDFKAGDFKPYLLRSADRGRTWTSVAGDLPANQPVWTLAEDPIDPRILYAGTEYGVFVTVDGGTRWVRLKGGLPTIPVRDLAIQDREDDLVLATFGRGFYILHDLSPLRAATALIAKGDPALLPVRDARMYVPASPLGGGPRGSQGDALWTAPNPPLGARFVYYLKSAPKTAKAKRQDAERTLAKKNADVPVPTWDELRAEDREEAPLVVLTVRDESGNPVRRLTDPARAGFHVETWNFRYPASTPVTAGGGGGGFGGGRGADEDDDGPSGPMLVPGTYQVQMSLLVDGQETPVGEPRTFKAVPITAGSLPAADRAAGAAFHRETARLQRAAMGAGQSLGELGSRLELLNRAIGRTAGDTRALADSGRALTAAWRELRTEFSGDQVLARNQEPVPPTIMGRVSRVVRGTWQNTQAPTATHRRGFQIASDELGRFLPKLRSLAGRIEWLEGAAEAAGVPWTPGRIPTWRP